MKKRKPKNKQEPKNQYHPPFCAALELDLLEYKGQIGYHPEYVLNSKPNMVDLMVTKENPDVEIQNGLGVIFKKYNLIEYKSPADSLSEMIYHRSTGYVHLFLAYHDRECEMEDVTLTLIRDRMPRKLMKKLAGWGFGITEYEPGIYHIKRVGHVDMQIVVTSRLGRNYKWITKLTSRLNREDMEDLKQAAAKLEDERDLLNAEAVFDLITRLNENKQWMKEMRNMGAFRDLLNEGLEEDIAELSAQLKNKDAQLQSKDAQLQNTEKQLENQGKQLQRKTEQLRSKEEENSRLKEEIAKLKKQLNSRSAMF